MQWDKGVMPLTSSHQKQYLRFEIQIPRNLKTGRSEKNIEFELSWELDISEAQLPTAVRADKPTPSCHNGIAMKSWQVDRKRQKNMMNIDEHCVPPNVGLAPQNLWETPPKFDCLENMSSFPWRKVGGGIPQFQTYPIIHGLTGLLGRLKLGHGILQEPKQVKSQLDLWSANMRIWRICAYIDILNMYTISYHP